MCCGSCPPLTSHPSLLAELVFIPVTSLRTCPCHIHPCCYGKNSKTTLPLQDAELLKHTECLSHTGPVSNEGVNNSRTNPRCLLQPIAALYCLSFSSSSSFKLTFSLCPACNSQRSAKTQTMAFTGVSRYQEAESGLASHTHLADHP